MEAKKIKTIRLALEARKNIQRLTKSEIRLQLAKIAIELHLHPDFDFDSFDFDLSDMYKRMNAPDYFHNPGISEDEKNYIFMIVGHIRDFWDS